uniref:Uncharacterized protein n=1 Tax=Panagrolaimus sp. ES5 TaxID=591445 RepID=A0AC34F9L4_9BILA
MMKERRLLQACLPFFLVSLSLAQYYPQQQYYYPQQQQQYFYEQQQTLQWPQQNIVYQQQQTFPQAQQLPQQQQFPPPQFQQQHHQFQQKPSQSFIPQQQQQPQPATSQQFYKKEPQPQQQQQQQQQRLQEPKISKPEEAFDLPQPPSRFLPEGSKIIKTRINQNFRRGGQISNQNQRRPSPLPRRQPAPPQPQRRIDVVHTRAPPPTNPDKFFLDCCQKKNVDKKCESRCNFTILSKRVLTGMFLGTDVCPQKYGLDLFACAAQDGDHRHCCRAKNVSTLS